MQGSVTVKYACRVRETSLAIIVPAASRRVREAVSQVAEASRAIERSEWDRSPVHAPLWSARRSGHFLA